MMNAKGAVLHTRYSIMSSSSVQPCDSIDTGWPRSRSSAAVKMPSLSNSHRMLSEPITGVMMNGSKEAKMIGPRMRRAVASSASARARPRPITSGRVTSVNVSVKRNALKKSMLARAFRLAPPRAARTASGWISAA